MSLPFTMELARALWTGPGVRKVWSTQCATGAAGKVTRGVDPFASMDRRATTCRGGEGSW